mgnify:CR=1 FL=1
MVIEIAQFTAQPGKAEELRAGLLRGLTVIRRWEACVAAEARRRVEDANVFNYQIVWRSLEDHQAFRASPLFAEYRSHINGLFVEPVAVYHYETLAEGD